MKKGKIETLIDSKMPFAIGVGDLFGSMDWFIMVHGHEQRMIRSGWKWMRSDCYVDVWTLGLNKEEIIEFREKYKHLFFRNMHNAEGTVYELKGDKSFKNIYRERKGLIPNEKPS